MCGQLSIGDDDQAVIADRFIPDNCPTKFKKDGEVSRKALFTHPRYWHYAYEYLRSIEKSRRRSHKRIDGSKSKKVSTRQQNEIFRLARQLGWDSSGEDDLKFRIMRFAARQTGTSDRRTVHPINMMTSVQASKVIQGLISQVNRFKK